MTVLSSPCRASLGLSFTILTGTTTPLREELEHGTPEILSTESESMPIKVETTMGHLTLDFQSIRFALDTDQSIKYEAIEKVCEEYWGEWRVKAEQSAPPNSAEPDR